MSVFTRLGRVLGSPKHKRTGRPATAAGEALVIEPKAPSRQEMTAELQKNYADAVELMRKVDAHLDRQESHAAQLMAVAERIEPAIESLPAIRMQHEALADSVEALRETTSRVNERSAEQRQEQLDALSRVQETLDASAEQERQIGQTLGEFRSSVDSVAGAAGNLADVLQAMRERDTKRDERLGELIANNTKWMVTLVGVCGLGVLAAIVLAIVAMS